MLNTGKILSFLILLTFGRVGLACPALGGTYLRYVGWFHDEKLSVVQDRCRSITLVYSPTASAVFDEASPRYLLDDQWHPAGDGRLYRARIVDNQVMINARPADEKTEDPGLAIYLDQSGFLTLAREGQSKPPGVLTYKRVEAHAVPQVNAIIAYDANVGWHVTDGDHAALSPVAEFVDQALEGLVKNAVYACELKAERSKTKVHSGLLVYDVNACKVVDAVKVPGA